LGADPNDVNTHHNYGLILERVLKLNLIPQLG